MLTATASQSCPACCPLPMGMGKMPEGVLWALSCPDAGLYDLFGPSKAVGPLWA